LADKIAFFPGSFDPVTRGHQNIINRAAKLFDKLIIGIGINSEKKNLFPIEQRKQWLEKIATNGNTEVVFYQGLTIQFAKKINASYLVRGLRTAADFDFEKNIAQMNKKMETGIETVFFLTEPQFSAITSSIVREIIRLGGDPSPFVPEEIKISLPL